MAIGTTTALILGASAVASAGLSAYGARQQAKAAKSTPQLPTPPPEPTPAQAEKTATDQTVKDRKKRTQTIFTSPGGLLTKANTTNQSLLTKEKLGT